MKLKKKIPVLDQHDKFGFWGGKFGGNFVPETLKKPMIRVSYLKEINILKIGLVFQLDL